MITSERLHTGRCVGKFPKGKQTLGMRVWTGNLEVWVSNPGLPLPSWVALEVHFFLSGP